MVIPVDRAAVVDNKAALVVPALLVKVTRVAHPLETTTLVKVAAALEQQGTPLLQSTKQVTVVLAFNLA
jgi:hypothetical protein